MSISDKIKEHKLAVAGAAGTVAALAPTMAFAEGETATASSAISTMAGNVATEGVNMFNTVLPVLTPLLAFGLLVGIGIKFVRKVTNKS